MSKTQTIPEAPNGWHWGITERSTDYFDAWLYTDAVLYRKEDSRGSKFGAEIHIWWDKSGSDGYHVELLPITRMQENGEVDYAYAEHVGEYDTEDKARQAAVTRAQELR